MTLKEDLIQMTDERNEWQTRCELLSQQRDEYAAQVETLETKVDRLEWENKGIAEWQHEWALMKANRDKAIEVVVTLTEERDDYAKAADTMAAAHKIERDELATTLAAIEIKVDALIVERDALKEAARLALDEMENVTYAVLSGAITADVIKFESNKAALKEVLK